MEVWLSFTVFTLRFERKEYFRVVFRRQLSFVETDNEKVVELEPSYLLERCDIDAVSVLLANVVACKGVRSSRRFPWAGRSEDPIRMSALEVESYYFA